MNIAVVGAGSLGLLFAGKLVSAVPSLRLLTRGPDQAAAINEDGLEVAEKGRVITAGCQASSFDDWLNRWPEFTPDWIFLTVKQRDIDEPFVRKINERLGSSGKLLCFQNGIGHLERLSEHVDSNRIYMAVTTEAAKRESARRVAHTGRGVTRIGPAVKRILPEQTAAEVRSLVRLLERAGFSACYTDDIAPYVWQKLLINAVINPLTAVLGVRNGELLRSPHSRRLMRGLLEEGAALARMSGIEMAGDLWDRLAAVCKGTADNDSSMLQDIKHGRTTEIDWINGSMIRLAEKYGTELPIHRALYLLVKAREDLLREGSHHEEIR